MKRIVLMKRIDLLEKDLLAKKGMNFDLPDKDFDYLILLSEIYDKVDPSIKYHLTRKGVTVVQNIYTGFDTEYFLVEDDIRMTKRNKLISVQLSVNTRSYLKIPLNTDYVVGSINTLTSEAFITPRSKDFNYKTFEDCVNECIKDIRIRAARRLILTLN
jgi:hypothetical protein